jgi:flavin reductase (DIM6/NTAB) family NADH-FMN oxidoreductase RutF
MSADLPPALWKKLTSTVGLVAVPGDRGTNVMACEWAYFVNKDPLYVAVVLGPRTASRDLIAAAGRFAVTFCADDQAELADFAGSCTVAEVDKATSAAIRFGPATFTPWVTGGVVAVECVLRQTVAMPVHTMYVGEVMAAHLPDRPVRPLVKHGGMHTLGDPVQRTAAVVATRVLDGGVLRVAATGPATDQPTPWRIALVAPDGEVTGLGEYLGDRYGDLLVDLPLPGLHTAGSRVRVQRDGAKAGYAVIDG